MIEEKSFFDELVNEKPESFNDEVFVKTKNKKKLYIGITILCLMVLIIAINMFNRVEVPDMSTWRSEDVTQWSRKNNINIIPKQVFSNTISKSRVIDQELSEGKKIKKKSSFSVTFSKGSDPNEKIEVPELKSMKLEEIQAWMTANQLTGINIKYDNSNSIPKGTVMSVNFVDGDSENFARKNRIKLVISKGPVEYAETLNMPDFYGKTKKEVVKWAVDNKIKLDIQESYNDFIEENNVISQTIMKQTKFNRSETLGIEISLGKPVSVPDFSGLTSGEAKELASLYNLRLFIKSIPLAGESDRIFYQDVKASEYVKKNAIITLHVSQKSEMKTVPLLVGLTKTDAIELGRTLGIKISYKMVENTKKNFEVLSQSIPQGSVVNENDIIELEISNSSIEIIDFTKLSKLEASAIAEDLGLKILFKPKVSTKYKKDKIIGQDIEAGSIVPNGSRIILNVADNLGFIVPNFSDMTKEDAEFWAKSKGYNLRVIDVYNTKVKKGKLYNQNHKQVYLPESEPVIVYHSLGKINLPDLRGENRSACEKWQETVNSNGANIEIEFKHTASRNYSVGQVADQKIVTDQLGLEGKVIFYIVSTVLSNKTADDNTIKSMAFNEFVRWCDDNRVTYHIKNVYSNSIKVDYVFGTRLRTRIPEGEILNVKKSLGNVPIVNFSGRTKADVQRWLRDVNEKEGNITISYVYQNGGVADQVVSQSSTSGLLTVGSTLTITLSNGQ